MRGRFPQFGWSLFLLVALLVGCGGSKAQPTAVPPATATPAAARASVAPTAPRAASPTVATRTDVPAKAYETLRYVETHNGDPPPGYAGGTIFENRERRLPPGRYKEYDVDPRESGGRNAERLVIDQGNGHAYYTGDHYDTFIPISSGR